MPATFIFKNLIRHVTKNKIKKDFKLLGSRKKVKSERYVSNFAFKCVFLKKTTNNIFVTITNSNCEPIFLASYGRAKIFTKKRRKSSEAFKDLTNFLIEKLKLLGLRKTRLKIFFQTKIKKFFRNVFFHSLKKQRFKIIGVSFVRIKCHNGLRKKKMRRV